MSSRSTVSALIPVSVEAQPGAERPLPEGEPRLRLWVAYNSDVKTYSAHIALEFVREGVRRVPYPNLGVKMTLEQDVKRFSSKKLDSHAEDLPANGTEAVLYAFCKSSHLHEAGWRISKKET